MRPTARFRRIIRTLGMILVLAGLNPVHAFSLLGPSPPWQTTLLSYQPNIIPPIPFVPAFGPMNLNEEYRWNIPTLYYGYTGEFYSYFGAQGEEAINEAVAMMNALPSVDLLDPDDYPLEAARINLRAQALDIWDIKSFTLSALLQMRGLTDPTRYVFTLRNRWVSNNIPFYNVVKRNFDPITLKPTTYVNGLLWTYNGIFEFTPPLHAFINRYPVDPLHRFLSPRVPVTSDSAIGSGFYWTGFTRDDIGGLKHVYRADNFNLENSLPSVTGGLQPPGAQQPAGGANPGATPPAAFPGGGGNFDFPSFPGVGSDEFDYPLANVTNVLTQAFPALRGGIQRIGMVPVEYDSLLGVYFEPFEERYSETILTNSQRLTQNLTRTITQPDFIFDAADLQGPDAQVGWTTASYEYTAWISSDALDGREGDDFGPGVIASPFRLVFNTAGPATLNDFLFFNSETTAIPYNSWGWFDGTARDPVVFPVGTSIRELEARLGR